MLEIIKEFRKGILFVRLKGVLNKDTVAYLNSQVTKVVADMGISNVVFNTEELTAIDTDGINVLYNNYNLCKDNHGISMICGVNKNIKSVINKSLLSNMFQIKDELSAMNLIEI